MCMITLFDTVYAGLWPLHWFTCMEAGLSWPHLASSLPWNRIGFFLLQCPLRYIRLPSGTATFSNNFTVRGQLSNVQMCNQTACMATTTPSSLRCLHNNTVVPVVFEYKVATTNERASLRSDGNHISTVHEQKAPPLVESDSAL